MDPGAVIRAAHAVHDDLDHLLGPAAPELRNRLGPLLAEEDRRPPEQVADAVVSLVAQYGPAWERLSSLLGPDERGAPGGPAAGGEDGAEHGPSVIGRLTGAFRRLRGRITARNRPEPETFPLIEAPGEVVASWGAEVEVGLSPTRGAADPAAAVPGPVDLEVQLVAEGFEAPGGWRIRLRADEASPYPRARVGLIALAQDLPVTARQIQAIYAVHGEVTGFGVRALAVLDSPGLLGQENVPHPLAGTRVRRAGSGRAPDVTAIVVHGDRPGRLWWTHQSPHFVTPDQPEVCELGMRASELGRRLADPSRSLEEVGRQVASQIPQGFWELLNAVAERVAPRRPSLLILSQEPHVPWELATLEHPLDRSVPGFLNCQVVTGRWPLGGRRPELPPPVRASGRDMAVVSDGPAHPLVSAHGAAQVSPRLGDVLRLLGDPPEMVHFATTGPAVEVLGGGMGGTPFVFLDSPADCQPFLLAGACGAVAPFRPAGESPAVEFYRRVLGGEPPAEALRALRCLAPATAPAYRFFGHPSLVLSQDHSRA